MHSSYADVAVMAEGRWDGGVRGKRLWMKAE